jgi:hypothetical protein
MSPKCRAYRNRGMGAKAVDDVRRGSASGGWRCAHAHVHGGRVSPA